MSRRARRSSEPALDQSLTEEILESARNLDQLSVGDTLGLIHREDGEAWKAVGKQIPRIVEQFNRTL